MALAIAESCVVGKGFTIGSAAIVAVQQAVETILFILSGASIGTRMSLIMILLPATSVDDPYQTTPDPHGDAPLSVYNTHYEQP